MRLIAVWLIVVAVLCAVGAVAQIIAERRG